MVTGTPPLLSIIIPTKNGETYISDALKSIYQQDYSHFEVIVVDGNSTDKTCKIVEEYVSHHSNIRLYSADDLGQSDAMNKGIKAARGEIVGILNDDDFYSPGCFQEVVAALDKTRNPSLVVGNCRYFDSQKKQVGYQQPRWLGLENFIFARQLHPSNSSQYFYHKAIHQMIGDYPVDEHFAMDLWFYLECCSNSNITLKYVNRDLGNFRIREGTKTWESRNQHAAIRKKYCQRYASKVKRKFILPALYRGFTFRLKNKIGQLSKKSVFLKSIVGGAVQVKERLRLSLRCVKIRSLVKKKIIQTPIQKLPTDKKLVVLLSAFPLERFSNLPLLVESALKCEFVEQVIVSNNNSKADISKKIKSTDLRLKIINQKEDRNCAFRIEMLREVPGEYFAVIDDDLFLLPEQIRELYRHLVLAPERVHGCYGENHFEETETMPYLRQRVISQEAPVEHLGRVYFFARPGIDKFIEINRQIKTSHDDLVLSFSFDLKPMSHNVGELIDCPTAHFPKVALSKGKDFSKERSNVLRALRLLKAKA